MFLLFLLLLCASLIHAQHGCGDGQCLLPKEASLCRNGFVESCTSLVCYDSDALCSDLAPEEYGFLGLCLVGEGLSKLTNCKCFNCHNSPSDRDDAVDCYGDNGIDVTEPSRGNCEAGGCCEPELPLCDLELYFFFMSLGYGVAQSGDSECESSLDYFGDDNGCTFLTDGRSNDGVVCSNAGITQDDDGRNYCDITFSGTNDAIDIVHELLHLFAPTNGRQVTFGSGENEITFTALEMLVEIALGSDEDERDGIVEIAFQAAEDLGCFTRDGAAVHLMGHSLGAVMANIIALKLAALYPEVYVKMTTAGEPSVLLEPLEGKAASLQAWSNKVRYINGRVLPRGPVFNNFLSPREYGLYQDYCWVSQVIPGGYVAGNNETTLKFLCEVKDGDSLNYFIANENEGCAAGLEDVKNDLPSFPHLGGIEFLDNVNEQDLEELNAQLTFRGYGALAEVVDFFNKVATVGDIDFQEAFFQMSDLHALRRSIHTLNLVYQNGAQCSSERRAIPLLPPSCNKTPTPLSWCFSKENTIEVLNKGLVSMSDLKIGDMVRNAHGKYDRIYSFGHRTEEARVEYLQLYVRGKGKPLEISEHHMLFVEGHAVPASTVVVGDKVNLGDGGIAEVETIKKGVIRVGAYAPFTTSGTLVVNGVVVSSYVSLQKNHRVLMIGGYQTPFSIHWLSHVYLGTTHRLACMAFPEACRNETYTSDGISSRIARLYDFERWLVVQNAVVMLVVLVPTFVVALAAYGLELVLASGRFLLIAAIILIIRTRFRKCTKSRV